MASALDRFYHAIRHPSASGAGTDTGTVEGFGHLRGKYAVLVTYKRNGDAVPTPVWFGLSDGNAYIRSGSDAAKIRRIRNDPRVRLAPCDARGKPLGPPAEGRARVLETHDEHEIAEAALKSNYGLGRKLYERMDRAVGASLVYLEVSPVEP